MQWLRQHRVNGWWLGTAVFFALSAILRLHTILTRGGDSMDLALLLMNAATAAVAALFAFRVLHR